MAEDKFTLPEEVAKYLGVDKEHESFDTFKTTFDTDFIRRKAVTEDEELQKAITGRRLGHIETELKKTAKDVGVDLEGEELKGLKVEELSNLILSKAIEAGKAKATDLQSQLDASDKEEVVKQLNEKITGLEGKLGEERTAKKTVQDEYATFQSDSNTREVKNKIQFISEQAFNEVKFKEGITDVERLGFKGLFDSKFNLGLDPENGAVIVTDKEGKKINNPDKAGDFLNLGSLLEQEANGQKLLKLNANGGQTAPAPFSANGNGAQNGATPQVQKNRTINVASRS